MGGPSRAVCHTKRRMLVRKLLTTIAGVTTFLASFLGTMTRLVTSIAKERTNLIDLVMGVTSVTASTRSERAWASDLATSASTNSPRTPAHSRRDEPLRQLAELLPRLRVIRLRARPCLPEAVEVLPTDIGHVVAVDEVHRGLHALLEGADGAGHDLRRHVRGGMQRVDGDAAVRELSGEIDGVEDLRELALAVRAHAAVAARQHGIVEVHRRLAGGADLDDPRRRGSAEEREELAREQVVRQVVHGEAQLDAVAALGALARGDGGADAGVVHEDVEARLLREGGGGEGTHLGERGEVGEVYADRRGTLRAQLLREAFGA